MRKPNRALQKNQLHLDPPVGNAKSSGHTVDPRAFTFIENRYRPWVFKHNKHKGQNGSDTSILEVAFSEVASLFIRPGLTPPANIVRDEAEQVMGVASEGFHVQIQNKISEGVKCYSFNPDPLVWTYPSLSDASKAKEIVDFDHRLPNTDSAEERLLLEEMTALQKAKLGVHFLDGMPPDFFHTLMAKHQTGEIIIDMDSLASILTVSYVLEEDDLHKGNIGFYVTDMTDAHDNTKKKFTFFKIDHDLMFMDSIMAPIDMRSANMFYNENSFKMTPRDLDGFPDLQDSGNHYWPTKRRTMVKGTKAYGNAGERQAFKDLQSNPDFIKAKWRYFFKYSVMPMELIVQSLTIHLDEERDIDKINLIKNSVSTRLAQLKQTLLASKGFMPYFREDGESAIAEIQKEIQVYMTTADISETEQDNILSKIRSTYRQLDDIATNDYSSLKKAMILDCYIFSATSEPSVDDLHWAKAQFTHYKTTDDRPNAFKYACILVHLTDRYETLPEKEDVKNISTCIAYKNECASYKNKYLKPEQITTFAQFIDAANKIRDCDLPLKKQKNELLAVLKNASLGVDELLHLKLELDTKIQDDPALGYAKKFLRNKLGNTAPKEASLKFINQLRSDLWLIRDIRGTYGTTATSSMMIKEIDRQLSRAKTEAAPDEPTSTLRPN